MSATTPAPASDPIGTTALAPTDVARRALVIGEALIDVVRRADGAVSEHPGGSPANVAIGLARLDRGVDLLTWFGADAHGEVITAHLTGAGVDVVPGSGTAERTSVATAVLDDAGVATYVFDLSWHVPASWTSPAAAPVVVHTGSIAAILEPGGADVARILAAHRDSATITYDPNMRPSLMPAPDVTRPMVEALVALSDVVKVSDEDLAWLEPGSDPVDVARRWATTGPAAVVVTRGGEGAVAVTAAGSTVEIVAPRVTVADTVGAGDSFMGGLIDGLWSAGLLGAEHRADLHAAPDATWTAVLERCARIAAITVSRAGANPPTTAELA
ncbi:carbohydrate kinase [Actinotalea sp.]|uniref:carbohydrate kinase family protein n=1 Tax=Actinotalea sp. TaxID=1872145 RepID=UPI002D0B3EA9|nr:carbohydrate kinase [Actinotalea sp.]HQY34361.1 carbohydrate kinase [Actinotalea sp.]HRA50327.1 carbohydrate kinase [Actinotalea sp.]